MIPPSETFLTVVPAHIPASLIFSQLQSLADSESETRSLFKTNFTDQEIEEELRKNREEVIRRDLTDSEDIEEEEDSGAEPEKVKGGIIIDFSTTVSTTQPNKAVKDSLCPTLFMRENSGDSIPERTEEKSLKSEEKTEKTYSFCLKSDPVSPSSKYSMFSGISKFLQRHFNQVNSSNFPNKNLVRTLFFV